MNITNVGSGYVGLVTGACFADVGHDVICVDNNLKRVETLRQGHVPIYEPGLEDIIRHNVSAHRLTFTTNLKEAVARSQVIFIAVAEAIIKITESKSQIAYQDLPEDDPKVRQPDITRARTLLGWEPQVPFEKGILNTVAYF